MENKEINSNKYKYELDDKEIVLTKDCDPEIYIFMKYINESIEKELEQLHSQINAIFINEINQYFIISKISHIQKLTNELNKIINNVLIGR